MPAPFMVPPRSVNPKFMLKLRGQSLGLAVSIFKGTLKSSPVVGLLLPGPEGLGWGSCCALCLPLHFTLHSVAVWETSLRLSSVCVFLRHPHEDVLLQERAVLGRGCAPAPVRVGPQPARQTAAS